jgi:hypothetical protein
LPVAKYNRYFGNKRGAAQETLSAMIARYGKEEGTRIFYATKNARKKKLSEMLKGRKS